MHTFEYFMRGATSSSSQRGLQDHNNQWTKTQKFTNLLQSPLVVHPGVAPWTAPCLKHLPLHKDIYLPCNTQWIVPLFFNLIFRQSTGYIAIQWTAQHIFYIAIRWMANYPSDSVIRFSTTGLCCFILVVCFGPFLTQTACYTFIKETSPNTTISLNS